MLCQLLAVFVICGCSTLTLRSDLRLCFKAAMCRQLRKVAASARRLRRPSAMRNSLEWWHTKLQLANSCRLLWWCRCSRKHEIK
jgi:hypothetical protein